MEGPVKRTWEMKNGAGYWTKIWAADDSHVYRVVILLVEDQYYVSAHKGIVPREEDIGPFESFEEARVAAETMMDLRAAPKHW